MYPFIESIKLLDGVFYRLHLHQARVNAVFAQFFPHDTAIDLNSLLSAQTIPQKGLYKCRIEFRNKLELMEFLPYQAKSFHSLQLVSATIEACNYKSANRAALDAAYAQRAQADDVLIVNQGLLTDTWFANIALWNGTEWHTPKTPLITGVQRADLLAKSQISPIDITPAMISNYSKICIFNAMIEFGEKVISTQSIVNESII